MSLRAVAHRHRLSWSAVMALASSWSALVAAQRRSRTRNATVLQNGGTGVLGMVAHRNQASLSGFLATQGRRWCGGGEGGGD